MAILSRQNLAQQIAKSDSSKPMKKKLAKSVGFVSLGCSKALVGSEKLINSPTSDGANIVDSHDLIFEFVS